MPKAQGGSHNHQLRCVENSFMGGVMENRSSVPLLPVMVEYCRGDVRGTDKDRK